MKLKLLVNIYLVVVFICLCGCVSKKSQELFPQQLSESQLCSEVKLQQLFLHLSKQNVQVVFVGDNIVLMLSPDKIFYKNSAHLNVEQVAVLDDIAQFLRCYQKISLQVTVNASSVLGSRQEDLAFSKLRSRHIVDYLWRRGVRAQLVSGKGTSYLKDEVYGMDAKQWVKIVTKKLP